MKRSRSDTHRRTYKTPAIRFEDQSLPSFSGLVVSQQLCAKLNPKERLRVCFSHLVITPIFGHHVIVLLLVVHWPLGYRELRPDPARSRKSVAAERFFKNPPGECRKP